MRQKLGLWLQALALLGASWAGIVAWWGAPGVFRGPATLEWPTAPAVVTKCETEVRVGRRGGQSTLIHFNYAYEVQGRRYFGERVSYGRSPVRAIDHWRKDQQIEVYYDPEHPEEAVVIPGCSQASLRAFFGGLAALGAAALAWWLGARLQRPLGGDGGTRARE